VATKKHFSNTEFLSSVREYLSLEAAAREIDGQGKAGQTVREWALTENTFYQFDAEAMSAIGSAIEDLALEEANGRLLTCLQHFTNFEEHRERYLQLAATINGVEVLAGGKLPSRIRGISFIKDGKGSCKEFWGVLYQGRRREAALLCQQTRHGRTFEDKEFVGFYTFTPWLISRIRQEMLDLVQGRASSLPQFGRQQAIDQTAKQLKTEFAREKEALGQAVCRLQIDGERYRVRQFMSDLEKGLLRLHQWKTGMSGNIARAGGQART